MRLLFISTIISFAGCISPTQNQTPQTTTEVDNRHDVAKNVYLINQGGCVYKDSLEIDSIGNSLFVDKKGTVYFKTFDYKGQVVLISRFYNGCEGDSAFDLARNIDIKSFRSLGMGYYKDKNNVIIHNQMSDGGNLGIIDEADVQSFTVIQKSFYAKDKKKVYYKGLIVETADPRSFQCVCKYTQTDTTCYFGRDSKNYFDGERISTKAEVEKYLSE